MEIIRASKCGLSFATQSKRGEIRRILSEYANVVNYFINLFWDELPRKQDLKASLYSKAASSTWLSPTMCQIAAREAIDMVKASKQRDGDKAVMPEHKGKKMQLTQQVVKVGESTTEEFDFWLNFSAIAADKSVKFSIPIKKHKHFNRLDKKGKRMNSYIVSESGVQFSFMLDCPKREGNKALGLDTGIKALASLSNGKQYGKDIEECIARCKRCKWGSKGHKRAQRALKQKIAETAKLVFAQNDFDLLVIEDLSDMNHKSKQRRRLCKTMRRSIGSWNWRLWLDRLKQLCEASCRRYRVVPPQHTSQTCNQCGCVDRANRTGERFTCKECGYACNADINAARNILDRFVLGIYGSQYQGVYGNVSSSVSPSVQVAT